MPSGTPGDGPVVDVVIYGQAVFTPKVDALVREIDGFTDDYGVFDPFEPVQDRLWSVWRDRDLWLVREGAQRLAGKETEELYDALVALRDRLRREQHGSRSGEGLT